MLQDGGHGGSVGNNKSDIAHDDLGKAVVVVAHGCTRSYTRAGTACEPSHRDRDSTNQCKISERGPYCKVESWKMLESRSHSVKGYQKRFKKLVSVAGKIHKGKESDDSKSGECLQRGASCPTVLSEYHRKETPYRQHPTAWQPAC